MNSNKALSEAAAAMGRKGGKSRSRAKITACRLNGRKGGRPRKKNPTKTR